VIVGDSGIGGYGWASQCQQSGVDLINVCEFKDRAASSFECYKLAIFWIEAVDLEEEIRTLLRASIVDVL
jgi:hypothetical protein